MNNNESTNKKEYLTLVQEYHKDAEGLREAGVSLDERGLVAKDYDDTLAVLREDMGVGQDDDELSRARLKNNNDI